MTEEEIQQIVIEYLRSLSMNDVMRLVYIAKEGDN
jgi:hypothetical protein